MSDKPVGLCYLATPYSKYPKGIDDAFIDASQLAARLLLNGICVYSPIAHTHPIATYGGIDPLAHDIWLPFDEEMMAKCDALVVAHMDSWEISRGIEHEIGVFSCALKPIWDLEPESLSLIKRT